MKNFHSSLNFLSHTHTIFYYITKRKTWFHYLLLFLSFLLYRKFILFSLPNFIHLYTFTCSKNILSFIQIHFTLAFLFSKQHIQLKCLYFCMHTRYEQSVHSYHTSQFFIYFFFVQQIKKIFSIMLCNFFFSLVSVSQSVVVVLLFIMFSYLQLFAFYFFINWKFRITLTFKNTTIFYIRYTVLLSEDWGSEKPTSCFIYLGK